MGVMLGELSGQVAGVPAIVTTADTGPTGRLRLRAGPSIRSPVVGAAEHGSTVDVESGPVGQENFYGVRSAGVFGYASGKHLSLQAPLTSSGDAAAVASGDAASSDAPSLLIHGMSARTMAISAGVAGVALLGILALAASGQKKKRKKRRSR